MKLSFVIPAYNEEAYLPLCLEAVLLEKKKGKYDIEIIVVNNASTDSTRQVALSYPGVLVVDEMKKGLSSARQAGLNVATGDLIANIDSDSVLTPVWTDMVMKQFSLNPELIALSGPFIYHDLSIFSNILVRLQYYIDYCVYLLNRFVFKTSSLLQGGNFVVKKEALKRIGGFNPEFVFWGEDTDVAKRLNPLGSVVFTFELPIYSSGRRLKKEGVFVMSFKYGVNFFWTILFGKPFSISQLDIRNSKDKQKPFRTNLIDFNKILFYGELISVFLFFSMLGGSAYVWNQTLDNVRPIQVDASVVMPEELSLKEEVNISIKKIHNKIKIVEEKFDLTKSNL